MLEDLYAALTPVESSLDRKVRSRALHGVGVRYPAIKQTPLPNAGA